MMIISQCVYFLHPVYFHSCVLISRTYISFVLICNTDFPFSLSLIFFLILSLKVFSYFFLLYFLCHVHGVRLPRQCSDQPENGIAYMTFLILCLYKKIELRKNDTRESRQEMIPSDPDTNSLLHVHFVFLICTILLCPIGILQHIV